MSTNMETKQKKCERIAKEMEADFLEAGIPKEQHVAAVAMVLSHLEEIKEEVDAFMEGVKRGLASRNAGRVYNRANGQE